MSLTTPQKTMQQRAIAWIQNNHVDGNAMPINHRQRKPYPEVTGYFIPTLLGIGEVALAENFARWLVTVQKEDGSFTGENQNQSFVFDTGQVIRGWVSIIDRIPELKIPLQRACDWIVRGADPKSGRLMTPSPGGDWNLGDRGELSEGVHLYVLKPLKVAATILGQPEISRAADQALIYYLDNLNLTEFAQPNMLTHFYGYIQEALFELGYIEKAQQGMASVASYQQNNGAVPAYFNVPWVCSTGLAQLALVWYSIGEVTRAEKAIDFLSELQNSSGGFFGSYGAGASYFVGDEISWAIKYTLDTLKLGLSFNEKRNILHHADKPTDKHTTNTENNYEITRTYKPSASLESQTKQGGVIGKTLISNLEPNNWHESITRGTSIEIIVYSVRNNRLPPWLDPIIAETQPSDSVLELGSGTGELSAHLAQRGRNVTLLDFSSDNLQFASNVFDVIGLTGDFIKGNVLEPLPFKDNSIDVVWSSGLLEHFDDTQIEYIITESARIARKKVISLVPNANSLAYRLGKYYQEREGRWIWGREVPKVTLAHAFRSAGLGSIREYSIAPEHALEFMDSSEVADLRSELTTILNSLPSESLNSMNQGYLLVTIGEVITHNNRVPISGVTEEISVKNKYKLVCLPNDPLEAYVAAGYPDLTDYFNPNHTFEEVYCVSPYESREYTMYGMKVLPTPSTEFSASVQKLEADCIRAYDIPAGHIACAVRIPNVPIICSVHDVNPARCPGPLPNADYFLAISGAVEQFLLAKGADSSRIIKFANRVDLGVFRPIRDDSKLARFHQRYPGRYRVLLVGRRTEQKNLVTLISALALLGEEYTGIFVGQGDAEPYRLLAHGNNIEHRCHFIDSVPNHELAEYYSFCDCFCTPSLWEGFGIVFIEALACEAIIVTSDIAPMNEYISQGVNGLLVNDYKNPKALAATIYESIHNNTLRTFIRLNARESAKRFSKNNISDVEHNIYEFILKKKSDKYNFINETHIPSTRQSAMTTAPTSNASLEAVDIRLPIKTTSSKEEFSIHMLTPDLEEAWSAVIDSSPDAWFFHSFSEQVLLEEVWPIQTMSFMLEWHGRIVAAFPFQRFKWSSHVLHSTNMGPAGIAFSGDLSNDDRNYVINAAYNILRQFCASMSIKQVQIALPPLTRSAITAWKMGNPLVEFGFEDHSTVTTVIDLEMSEADILNGFSNSHKRNLKKAINMGIKVFIAKDISAVDDYYRIHVETYTRTGATPHPREYFEAIYRYFVATGRAHWLMAMNQGRIIGAMNMAVFGQGSLYWTGAYTSEGLSCGAGQLLQWEAIKYAKSICLTYYETGEIFPEVAQGESKLAGLTEFKRRFGGRIVPFRKGLLNVC